MRAMACLHQFEDVTPRLAVKQLDHTVTSYAQDNKLLSDVAISLGV